MIGENVTLALICDKIAAAGIEFNPSVDTTVMSKSGVSFERAEVVINQISYWPVKKIVSALVSFDPNQKIEFSHGIISLSIHSLFLDSTL